MNRLIVVSNRLPFALDSTGEDLWTYPFKERTTGTPMTYSLVNGRQFVVIATGSGDQAAIIAFSLTSEPRP